MPGGSGGSASGRLVVLDRSGRASKSFLLATGAATIGRALSCDVRVLLPSVAPHHASLLVHRNQTLIHDSGTGETLVNGAAVSVAALQHGDVITVGGRHLRWEYDSPRQRPLATQPALYKPPRSVRAARRHTAAPRDPAPPRRALLNHRASMPGSAGGKQVAIVQPQRRDTNEQIETQSHSAPPSPRSTARSRSRLEPDSPQAAPLTPPAPSRASFSKCPPHTTVATLWIESRKQSPAESRKSSPRKSVESRKSSPRKTLGARKTPRRSTLAARQPLVPPPTPARPPLPRAVSAKKRTPLRVSVLRRARSAQKPKVTKIEAPLQVDHMKQAALLLMAGRSPRVSLSNLATHSHTTVSLVEITDSSIQESSTLTNLSSITVGSPLLPSPRKSALKDPKRTSRKTESIKFDLSNLESFSSQDEDELMETGRSSVRESRNKESSRESRQSKNRSTRSTYTDASTSEEDLALHYSDTSRSPSPRRPIHSRTNTILELSGSPLKASERKTLTPPESPSARKSLRGSIIVQKALESSKNDTRHSRRSSKTLSDNSFDSTAESAFRTRTMSPRSARNLESYSIVDLVSSKESNNDSAKSGSVYDSAGSTRTSSIVFGTPRTANYSTRSTIDAAALSSSTPYVGRGRASTRSQSSPNISKSSPNKSTRSSKTRRSKSLTTPENSEETQKHISINSTKISRASKSRSRLNDSDLLLITSNVGDGEDSPRTSRRNTTANLSHSISALSPKKSPSLLTRTSSPIISSPKRVSTRNSSSRFSNTKQASPRVSNSKQTSPRHSNSKQSTPKSSPKKTPASKTTSPQNARGSRSVNSDVTYVSSDDEGTVTPENVITPQEQGTPVLSIQTLLNSSQSSFSSQKSQKSQTSRGSKRKTIGVIRSDPKRRRNSPISKSFTASTRRSLRALRLNSRESDRVNESILSNDEENVTPKTGGVKLVQEAVKNKHSTAKKPQSKRSIIDNLNDSDIVKQLFNSPVKRKLSQSMTEFSRKKLFDDEEVVKRPTRNTMYARTPDQSIMDNTDRYTPENFVSPLSTPGNSPNLTGIKRLYTRSTPRNDLTDVKGVKGLLRSPRTRKSVKNDLTNVSGVKNLMRTRKSVRNDLTNVSGVKNVFAASPTNDLRRVSGVKSLFKRQKEKASPKNDLRNVSGVKKTLVKSPKNDLRDVRGVKHLFKQNTQKDDSYNLSGVEELFNESNISSTSHRDPEVLFDQLIGKPPIKAVYSKSYITKRPQRGKISRQARSLRESIDLITNNVEVWLEKELNKHLHKDSTDKVSRALQQLATDTVEGSEPLRRSRIRNSSLNKSQLNVTDKKKSASEIYDQQTLPIKKRSVSRTESLNRSGVKSVTKSAVKLPIKKRVVHSTPVKGRANLTLTMNASGLGRVSPIALEQTTQDTTHINRSKQSEPSPKGKSKHTSKVTFTLEPLHIEEHQTAKSPPKKGETSQADKNTSVTKPPRPKRGTRSKNIEEPVHKKPARAGSKTAEVKSPVKRTRTTKASVTEVVESEPKAKRGRGKATNESQPKTTNTTNNTEDKVVPESPKARGRRGTKAVAEKSKPEVKPSPKRTRARQTDTVEVTKTKSRKQSLVITKKAPVMSPKPTKKLKETEAKPESPKIARSTRQKAMVELPKSPLKTRAKLVIAKPSPKLNPRAASAENLPQTRRGRKQPQTDKPKTPSPKKPRKATKEIPKSPEKKPSPPKRGRPAANKSLDVEPPAKKGRKAKNVTVISPKKTRGKAEATVSPTSRPNRSTKSATEAVTQTNVRKRKSDEPTNPVPAKVAKTTRGRKAAESLVVTISPKGKRTVSPVKEKATRGRQNMTQKDESQTQVRSTRRAGKVDNTQTNHSPANKRKQSSPKESPAKKAKVSQKAVKASPVEKAGPSRAKKVISSPAKKIKASPVKKGKASPAKKGKASAKSTKASPIKTKQSPVKKAKASPVEKAKASPVEKAKASPVKKAKASPVKKAKASPAKKASNTRSAKVAAEANVSPVKKTRGGKKVTIVSPPSKRGEAVAASPAKAVRNTRSRRR